MAGIYFGQRQKNSILKHCTVLLENKDSLTQKLATEIQKHENILQQYATIGIKTPEYTQILNKLNREKEKIQAALEFIQAFEVEQ